MIIGPKYKLARRLGAPIFEKTQSQKFNASKERRQAKFSRPRSAYGNQLNEKQKARLMYGVSERQFKNYVNAILDKGGADPQVRLFEELETRLDNVVYRAGFARSRREARQLVSHGHIKVNGRRNNIPSYKVRISDLISPRKEDEVKGGALGTFEERFKDITVPAWLSYDKNTKELKIVGQPMINATELMFDLSQIIEYYRR